MQTQIITAKTELNDSNSQTAAENLINDENESISVVTIIVEELLDGLFIRDQDESFDHNNVEHYQEKELNISQNTNLDDSDPFYNSERGQSLDTANCPNDDLDYEPLENNIGHTADNSINTTRDDFLQETENPIEPSLTKENNVNLDLNFSDISENIETSQDSNDITESHAFNQSNNKNKDEDTMHNNSKTKELTLHEISNTNICSLNKEPANEYEKDLSDLESFITSIPTVSVVDTAAFIVEELIDSLIYTVVATVEDKAKGVNYIENVEELDSSNINDSSISDLDISGELFDNLEMYDHSTDALNEMINKHLMPSESVIAPVQRTFSVITNTSERSNTPKESSENITVNNSIDIDDLLDGSDEDECFR